MLCVSFLTGCILTPPNTLSSYNMYIDGRGIRDRIQAELTLAVSRRSKTPCLAIVIIGSNPVIEGFVRAKKRFAETIGVEFNEYRFEESISEDEILRVLEELARDQKVSGIVVQLPLSEHLGVDRILNAIPAAKDVDVLSHEALNSFSLGTLKILPPVVGAVQEILREGNVVPQGRKALVVGQGRLVGVPVAVWLRQEGAQVTVVGEPTEKLSDFTKTADLIVSGAGSPGLIQPEMLTPGVVLIDAGSSESLGKIVGDVDPACESLASVMTPVPGGVGPVTVAVLFRNLIILSDREA